MLNRDQDMQLAVLSGSEDRSLYSVCLLSLRE